MPKRQAQLQDWLNKNLLLKRFSFNQIAGDASFRKYYRLLFDDGNSAIAVDAPPEYENCKIFLDITERLRSIEVYAPKVLNYDLDKGFMLIEDLGDDLYLSKLREETADTLYKDAIDTIIKIQKNGNIQNLPTFNQQDVQTEINLFIDWFLIKHLKKNIKIDEMRRLKECFEYLKNNAINQPKFFTHKDFHSRNLIFTEGNNPGVIDYQDAVNGPISYDLVSLLRDCYISWPEEKVQLWVNFYKEKAKEAGLLNSYEFEFFQEWFDSMGIQRHLKAIGIFSRLYHRDGKKNYIKDIPRVMTYIIEVSDRWSELKYLNLFLKNLSTNKN